MNPATGQVVVAGDFDDIRSKQIRFLEEAARLGPLTVLLWTDDSIRQRTGKTPKFPLAERQYFLERIRYVHRVVATAAPDSFDTLPPVEGGEPKTWVVPEAQGSAAKRAFCLARGWDYRVLNDRDLAHRLAKAGRELVEREYNQAAMATQIMQLYQPAT